MCYTIQDEHVKQDSSSTDGSDCMYVETAYNKALVPATGQENCSWIQSDKPLTKNNTEANLATCGEEGYTETHKAANTKTRTPPAH